MLIDHERRLLSKAAEAVNHLISIRQNPDTSWPSDHSRLCALASKGELRWIGERARPHLGGVVATWQITDEGLTRLGSFGGYQPAWADTVALSREPRARSAVV